MSSPGNFEFTADDSGRPLSAEGWLVTERAARNHAAQKAVSAGLAGYDAGHLIPARFGGPGTAKNLVPMPAVVNRSYVSAIENAIARHAAFGPVFLRVTVSYSGEGRVPQSMRHELLTCRSSDTPSPVPGGDIYTNVEFIPFQAMGKLKDPYTGQSIAPKEFHDISSTKGLGPFGHH